MKGTLFYVGPLVGALGCSSPSNPGEELGGRHEAILGGEADTQHEAVVALVRPLVDGYAVCTGTIIDARADIAWILTAAHCVVAEDGAAQPLPPEQVSIFIGPDWGEAMDAGEGLPATQVVVAPDYNGFIGNPNDVALIRFPAPELPLATLGILTPANDALEEDDPVVLVGFGETEEVINFRRNTVAQEIAWLDDQFIGIDQTSGAGICHGDSGGPVLVDVDGQATIAGVNSLGGGEIGQRCAHGSAIRIARFSSFIAETLAEDVPPTGGGGAAGAAGGGTERDDGTPSPSDGCSVSRRARSAPGLSGFALLGAFLWMMKRRSRRYETSWSERALPVNGAFTATRR